VRNLNYDIEQWISVARSMSLRPDRDQYFLAMAMLASSRSTCARAARGCVLVSEEGHVLATGYNGVGPGETHCLQDGPQCEGAVGLRSGEGLDLCEATHAEANALVQCSDPRRIATCYSTVSPCMSCMKLLKATGCRTLVFLAPYADWDRVRVSWERAGRSWRQWE
jgi:dCMP deaminase